MKPKKRLNHCKDGAKFPSPENVEHVDPALWIRDDCRDLYEQCLKSAQHCRLRARLIKLSVHQAYKLVQQQSAASVDTGATNNNGNNCQPFQFLEFGVYEGNDIARIASLLAALDKENNNDNTPNTIIHGFDSFEGLPTDWENGQYRPDGVTLTHQAGAFDCQGQIPNLNDPKFVNSGNHHNVVFHKGWFDTTVEAFFNNNNNSNPQQSPVAFVHADADLYTSTKIFLDVLCHKNLLVPGSTILFDEYWNYEGWEANGEYKAWMEAVQHYQLQFRYLAIHAMTASTIKRQEQRQQHQHKEQQQQTIEEDGNDKNDPQKQVYNGYQAVCVLIVG